MSDAARTSSSSPYSRLTVVFDDPAINMDSHLQVALIALNEEAQDIDEATQLRFAKEIDPANHNQIRIVNELSRSVTNICPRLALRLAIWHIRNGDLKAASAVVKKALENSTDGIDAGKLTSMRLIVGLSATCCAILELLDDGLDEQEEEEERKKEREEDDDKKDEKDKEGDKKDDE
ncbi:hypothetical protein F4824DRAFT_409602 [Ustulina deusta]|nr:hypothetical protein F4824DRAFT_409602 [Ustulina deusta]